MTLTSDRGTPDKGVTDGKTVIVAQTFSKSYSPGIRVGWGILPHELVEPVCNQKANLDFGSPNFSQHLMAKVLELGLFDPHLEQVRESYRTKLAAMLEAADEHLGPLEGVRWMRPDGGLYIWLALPEEIETGPTGELFEHTLQEGTLYVPGEYCYPSEGTPRPKNMIRLSFGVQSPQLMNLGDDGDAVLDGHVQPVERLGQFSQIGATGTRGIQWNERLLLGLDHRLLRSVRRRGDGDGQALMRDDDG